MKNKILTKVILIVVSICTLVVTFVIPSFAYTPSQFTVNAYSYRNDNGEDINLHLPQINALLYPIADSSGFIDEEIFEALTTNVNLVNYGGEIPNGYINTSGRFSENYNYASYSIRSFYDRGRVYDDVPQLQNTPFVGVQNDANNIYLAVDSNIENDGLAMKEINVNDFYLYNKDYSWIAINSPMTSQLTYDYTIEYFDNIIGEFQTKSAEVVVNKNSSGNYVIRLNDPILGNDSPENSYFVKSLNIRFPQPLIIYYNGVSSNINVRFAVTSQDYYEENTEAMFQKIKSVSYQNGFRDGSGYDSTSWFDSILSSVDSFLSWEFIPQISFGGILTIVLAVVLVIAFLKFFAGG